MVVLKSTVLAGKRWSNSYTSLHRPWGD